MNERDELIERTAAAVTMLRRTRSFKRKNELDAFMSIFHPKVFADRKQMDALRKAQIDPEGNL